MRESRRPPLFPESPLVSNDERTLFFSIVGGVPSLHWRRRLLRYEKALHRPGERLLRYEKVHRLMREVALFVLRYFALLESCFW